MPITRLYTTVLLPTCPLPDCIPLFRNILVTTSWWRNGSVQVLKLPKPENFPGADVGSDHDMVMMTFQTRLKNSRKPIQPRIRFDLEKLNDSTVMSAFQAIIGGRFASLTTLADEGADLDTMVTRFNKAVTDTAAELLGKQRQKRKPWVTPEILDLCDQRRHLKKKRGESEEAKDYREIKRKIRTEMMMAKETWT